MSTIFAKKILSSSLPVLAFLLGIILIMSVFVGVPYIFNNIGNPVVVATYLGLFLIGISFFLITILLIGIISSSKTNIFVIDNIKRFKNIGYLLFLNLLIDYLSFVVIGMEGIRLLDLAPGIFITPSMAIYLISSLICFVIADSFASAIKFKNDNDLTI